MQTIEAVLLTALPESEAPAGSNNTQGQAVLLPQWSSSLSPQIVLLVHIIIFMFYMLCIF